VVISGQDWVAVGGAGKLRHLAEKTVALEGLFLELLSYVGLRGTKMPDQALPCVMGATSSCWVKSGGLGPERSS